MSDFERSEEREFGRTLPHNLQAEAALLGAMLLSENAVLTASELLVPGDFYKPAHGHVYQAITECYDQGRGNDAVTVADQLKRNGLIDTIGGAGVLVSLMNDTPAIGIANRYAKLVYDHSKMRKLMMAGSEIVELAMGRPEDVDGAVDWAEARIFEINEAVHADTTASASDLMIDSMDRLEHLFKMDGKITGLPSGFIELDELMSGLQPNALNIIGARPAMGKTALALNIAMHAAIREGKSVLMFSLEMGHLELTQRMISAEGRIDSSKLKNGNLYEDDFDKIASVMPLISDAPISIDDNPMLSIQELRAKARRIHNQRPLDLIVVDYLQLMSGQGGNRQEEVSAISRGLKILARELKCTIIALSQLSRNLEQRLDKRPMLSDLRESGSLEQDADVVMFIYRDEVYNPDSDAKGMAELIVAKHRNGPIGTVNLAFFGPYTRFASMAKGER